MTQCNDDGKCIAHFELNQFAGIFQTVRIADMEDIALTIGVADGGDVFRARGLDRCCLTSFSGAALRLHWGPQ